MFISQLLVASASGKVNGSQLPGKWCTGLTSARAGFFIVFSPQRVESYQLHPVCRLGWKRSFFKLLHVPRIKWVPVSPLLVVALVHWVHLCLLQQSLCAILHTQRATRAAGAGHLPKVRQLWAEFMHSIPKWKYLGRRERNIQPER